MKVGDVVNPLIWELGSYVHMEQPYTFAHSLDEFFIWDQETGIIVWQGEKGLLGAAGYRAAWEMVKHLNGSNPYAAIEPAWEGQVR